MSFRDLEGVCHSVEVQAESMYEAAVLGLSVLRRSAWSERVSPGTRLEIQVTEPTATHILLVAQLTRWLDASATTPAAVLKKKKLKELLGTGG